MDEKKKYSVKELAEILGCSITAVQKKITADVNNPDIKRYRNRYEAVIKDGKTVILLTDDELENEKRSSKGFKNINQNAAQGDDNVIDAEYTAENRQTQDLMIDKVLTFTDGYIKRYEELQQRYYNLLNEKDKQVKLLTDSKQFSDNKLYEEQAKSLELTEKNKALETDNTLLKNKNAFLKRLLYAAGGVILIAVTLFLTVFKTV